jgi:predicted glycoside hydrolase/deacetylase ChbG (UPF0249 family)
MRQLIINADDFGLSDGVNAGIAAAHAAGIVTSCSLMVDAPAVRAAVAVAQANPGLSVGLHFVEPPGCELDRPTEAHAALSTQLDVFRTLVGRDPTHLDSHHHVHRGPTRMPLFAEVAHTLGVPLRHTGDIGYIGGFYGQWEPGVTDLSHLSRDYLLELIASEARGPVTELACHPAASAEGLGSGYDTEREYELATLTSPGLRAEIDALGIALMSFDDVARRGGCGAPAVA